jgi:Notch 1
MQSLQNLNMDNYGYTLGNHFPELILQHRGPHSIHMGDQGLSPPYSNQSPPHSVQSNIALSPQGYIGKYYHSLTHSVHFQNKYIFYGCAGSPSPAKTRPSLPTSPTHMQALRHATQQKHGNQLNSIGSTNGVNNMNNNSNSNNNKVNGSSLNANSLTMAGQQQQQQQQVIIIIIIL